jgi:hypothetical protein
LDHLRESFQQDNDDVISVNSEVSAQSDVINLHGQDRLASYLKEHKDMTWKEISIWDKARLFNLWSIVTLIANFLLIIGTVLYLIRTIKNIELAEISIGFGTMLTWLSLTRYFESSK